MMPPSAQIQIGDTVEASIVVRVNNIEWKVSAPDLPTGWEAVLRSRDARLYLPGDVDLLWVFGIVQSEAKFLLSDSDFGRLTISDRMRPRYVRALEAVLALLADPTATPESLPDALSEAKGMMNRCIRKDQWDWLSVYEVLGWPTVPLMRQLAEQLGELARAARHGDHGEVVRITRYMDRPDIRAMLQTALTRIVSLTPRLSATTALQSVNVELRDRPAAEETPEEDPYIVSQLARAKQEQANSVHQATLHLLVTYLTDNGFLVERSRLVDAYCRLRTGPAIFEVKSVTQDNERTQCRHALSRLYEYRYLHEVPEATLWLVLSERPSSSWLVDYLEEDRGVGVIWVEDGKFSGPGMVRLLESASAERRRKSIGN